MYRNAFTFIVQHAACSHLHEVADVFAVGEDLGEVLGAEDVTQSCLSEQAGRPMRVLDVGDRDGCVGDAVVDDGVDGYCHRILRQDLSARGRPQRVKLDGSYTVF